MPARVAMCLCTCVCLRIVFLLPIQKPTFKFSREQKIGLVGLARDPTCRNFLWLNVLGLNICRGACYGKNAHSVGGTDWRHGLARRNGQSVGPMITHVVLIATECAAFFSFWSSCGKSRQQLRFERTAGRSQIIVLNLTAPLLGCWAPAHAYLY